MKKDISAEKKQFIYPDLIFNYVWLLYLIFGGLITLAIIKPFGLGDVADPLQAPEVVKPEWYFLAFFQFINYLPKGVGTSFVFLGIFILCFWPFLPGVRGDRKVEGLGRTVFRIFGLVFVFSYLVLTLIGYLAESDRVILGKKYHFDTKGLPHRIEQPVDGATSDETFPKTGGHKESSGEQ